MLTIIAAPADCSWASTALISEIRARLISVMCWSLWYMPISIKHLLGVSFTIAWALFVILSTTAKHSAWKLDGIASSIRRECSPSRRMICCDSASCKKLLWLEWTMCLANSTCDRRISSWDIRASTTCLSFESEGSISLELLGSAASLFCGSCERSKSNSLRRVSNGDTKAIWVLKMSPKSSLHSGPSISCGMAVLESRQSPKTRAKTPQSQLFCCCGQSYER